MAGFDTTVWGKNDAIYKTSSNKGPHMLGTRMVLDDGRVFRYSKSGAAAITIGKVCGHQVIPANLGSDNLCSGAAARTTAQWDAGTHTVIVATTASATTAFHIYANRYDDGYLWVTDQGGEGQLLQIRTHGVSTSSGSTGVTFTMYDEDLLTVALTTASQYGLLPNIYSRVLTHAVNGAGVAIGVAPIAVGANKYFWLQTWGPCPVLTGIKLPVAGDQVCVICNTGGTTMDGVAGAVYPAGATQVISTVAKANNNTKIGYCLVPAVADADFSLIYLTIAP